MAIAERERIAGVWGRSPSGVKGQSPRSRGRGTKLPTEAESFEAFAHLKKARKAVQTDCLSIFQPSEEQVLPSRWKECEPLSMPMGAHEGMILGHSNVMQRS